jgi:hypothetical protein
LTVECSDLLKNAKNASDCKKLLKVSPFMIRMEMQLDRLELDVDEKIQVTKAAQAEADKVQQEIEKELNDLVKTVLKLQKEDAAGNSKAESEAEKQIEASHKKIESQLPQFGRRIRKAIEAGLKSKGRKHKMDSSVKSSATGSFKEIVLIADFQSGSDSEFQSAFSDAAKNLDELIKEAVKYGDEEEKRRTSLIRSLSDELEDIADYKKKDTAKESSSSKDEYDSKNLRTKARSMESNFGQYVQNFEEYKKVVDKAAQEFDRQVIKLGKSADNKEKSLLKQTKDKLTKLQRDIAKLISATSRVKKQYGGTFTLDSWETQLSNNEKFLRNLTPPSAKELEQTVKQLSRLFK